LVVRRSTVFLHVLVAYRDVQQVDLGYFNVERLVLDLYYALELENVFKQEVHETNSGLRLNFLILLIDFIILLLIGSRRVLVFLFALILHVVQVLGRGSPRHHLLLAKRQVEQIEQSQVHLRVHLEFAIFLQDAKDAQLPVENEVLVGLDQNICDGHDTIFEGFLLKLVEKLWGRNFLASGLYGNVGHVAVLGADRRAALILGLFHVLLFIVEESDIVIEHLQEAVNVILLNDLPLDARILGNFQN
jgi:hypothetical protein